MVLRRSRGAGAPKLWEPRPFRVLALDPGGTTGWALATYDGNPELDFKFVSGHLTGDHYEELFDFLHAQWLKAKNDNVPLELVYESFEFRQHMDKDGAKTKVELMSCEYIGVVKLFGQVFDQELHSQTASAAKGLLPDKGPQANVKLKQVGVYMPVTHWVHAMDAMRHLLKYMVVGKVIRSPITDKWV